MMKEQAMTIAFTRILSPLARALREAWLSHPRLRLKQQPGKDIYVVGGAALVGSLITAGCIDELRLTVHSLVLGRAKALFKSGEQRQRLALIEARPLKAGLVSLLYTLR
jgi:dihydrofolate reductase